MADPAEKLTPERRRYLAKLAKRVGERKSIDGISSPSVEHEPPNLELLYDDVENEVNGEPEFGEPAGDSPSRLGDQRDNNSAKVPNYQYNEPGAEKVRPGGEAIQPKAENEEKEKSPEKKRQERERELNSEEIDPKTGKMRPKYRGAKRAFKQIDNKIKDIKEKYAKEAIKKAIKDYFKRILAAGIRSLIAYLSPYWVPIVLTIVGLFIVAGAIFIFVKARQTPNAGGASPTIAADVMADRELIQTILVLSDPAKLEEMLADNRQSLLKELQDLKTEIEKIPEDPRTAGSISKIDRVVGLINDYTKVDNTKAQEIKNLLDEITKPWIVELNPDGMIWPLGKNYRKIGNTYRKGHAGIDVGVPIGLPLYAATNGKIVYLVQNYPNWKANQNEHKTEKGYSQNGGFGNMIIVEMDNPIGEAKYWEVHHLSPGTVAKNIGDRLEQGEMFGLTGHNGSSSGPHIHFGVCKKFVGTSCNNRQGGYEMSVDPSIPLGWK